MALGDPYISGEELATYLTTTTPKDGDLLDLAAASATAEIDQWCGRQFNQTTTATARTFRADTQFRSAGWPEARYSLYVDDFYTTTGLAVSDGDTVLDVADLTLLPSDGVIGGVTGFPYSEIAYTSTWYGTDVTVTAKWGWSAVPPMVKQACYILAAETFKQKDAPFGVAGVGEFGVIRIRENPRVSSLLAPYRLLVPFVA